MLCSGKYLKRPMSNQFSVIKITLIIYHRSFPPSFFFISFLLFLLSEANMTNLTSLTIIFIVTAIFTVSPSHCSRVSKIHPNGKTLIDTTCKNTPNYNLCVQSLKSDPSSSSANIAGLGLIMVKVTAEKAKAASNRIQQLLQHRGGVGAKQEKALRSCGEMYKVVVENDVPEAIEALKKGDPKFGEDGVRDARDEATYCEEEFSGVKSLLTRENNAVRDAAAVTVAIVRQLL